jgi:DNA-directed RNA polymerase specialized sigma24 family protein
MEVLEAVAADINSKKQTEEVYKSAFPGVAAFVSRMGGSFDDARDVFHDALIVFFGNKAQKHITIRFSEEAYILGIAKHLWIRKFNRNLVNIPLDEMEREISISDVHFPTAESKRLLRFIEITGKKCMDLLRSFYFENKSIKRVAGTLGYSNEHSASVQKYKCLEKIRETIKEKSLSYEDFIE